MANRKQNIAEPNVLSDEEWLVLVELISAIVQADTHEDLRYQTLLLTRKLIPFQTAAFFLADPHNEMLDGCLLAQPVGDDISTQEIERYLYATKGTALTQSDTASYAWRGRNDQIDDGATTELGGHELDDHLMLSCMLDSGEEVLGAINFSRTPYQGAFSSRDQYVLEVLAPYLTQRLALFYHQGNYGMLKEDRLREEYHLTQREIDVMRCVAYGMTTAESATKLTISPNTVRKHLESIHRKTNVNNRMSLMKFAQQFLTAPDNKGN